jgi:hypothetical protein
VFKNVALLRDSNSCSIALLKNYIACAQSEMEQALNAMRVDEHKTVMPLSNAESSLLDRRNKKKHGDTPVGGATHTDVMME